MSVDFTAIINNFLTAELGEEVRGSLVEIARAVQDAINSQLHTVTSDLTDTDPNAAARASAVGTVVDAFSTEIQSLADDRMKTPVYEGVLPDGTDLDDLMIPEQEDLKRNSIYRLISSNTYDNAPEDAGYVLTVYRYENDYVNALQVFFGGNGNIYTRFVWNGVLDYAWAGGTDRTLTKRYAAADAKKVGDVIYSGRDRSTNTPHIITWFSDADNLASFNDMPAWSITTMAGATIKTLAGNSFPNSDDMGDSISYSVKKESFGADPYLYIYTIKNLPGTRVWTGYTTWFSSTISWVYSYNKLAVYEGRDTDLNVPHTLTWYRSAADQSFVSFASMPSWSICLMLGSQIKSFAGNSFPNSDDMSDSISYIVQKEALGVDPYIYVYTIRNIPGTRVWTGYTTWSSSEITWAYSYNKLGIYEGRDPSTNTPHVLTWFSGINSISSLSDLPAWSVSIATGEQWKTILGNSFPYAEFLSNSTSYLMRKEEWGTNPTVAYRYTLSNLQGYREWIGYTTWNSSDVKWNFIEFQNTLEQNAVEVYADFDNTESCWYNLDGSLDTRYPERKHSQLLEVRPSTTYFITHQQSTSCIGAVFNRYGAFIKGLKGKTASEEDDGVDLSVIEPTYADKNALPSWQANTSYALGDKVLYNNRMYRCIEAHTSGSTFNSSKWVELYSPAQAAHDEPDISIYPVSKYMNIYRFTTPSSARYISLNLSSTYSYKLCLSSKPIFMLGGTGNIVINKNDPAYQNKKNKRLCVIGPSTLMIDRLLRDNGNGNMVPGTTEKEGFISGLQEYVAPWYAEVKTFGYSGAGYANNTGSSTGRCSIYTRICGGTETFTKDGVTRTYSLGAGKDLSGYDEFIIFTSGNGLSTVGEFTDEDPTTYAGAVWLICKKILNENPYAKIYIRNFTIGPSTADIRKEANVQLKAIADRLHSTFIDMNLGGISNELNSAYFTYDGTHSNNIGNQNAGIRLRKEIIGF